MLNYNTLKPLFLYPRQSNSYFFTCPNYSFNFENKNETFGKITIKNFCTLSNNKTEYHEIWDLDGIILENWLKRVIFGNEIKRNLKKLKPSFSYKKNSIYEISFRDNILGTTVCEKSLICKEHYSVLDIANNWFHVITFYSLEQKKKYTMPISQRHIKELK